MKTQIIKTWYGKKKIQKVFLKEYGWVNQTKCYLFGKRGLCFLTVNNAIEVLPQVTEPEHLADLEELAMYIEWRNKCHLPYIENSEFYLTLKKFESKNIIK